MSHNSSLKQQVEAIKSERNALQQKINSQCKLQKKHRKRLQEQDKNLLKQQKRLKNLNNKICSSSFVCTLCSQVVLYKDRRKHLRKCHQMYEVGNLKDYFITRKTHKMRQHPTLYYNPNAKPSNCGKVIKGAPPAKIIYTPVETNRRKH